MQISRNIIIFNVLAVVEISGNIERSLRPAWQDECLKAKCDVIFQPKCPEDSILILSPPPVPPDCCQKPGYCECNQEYCHERYSQCPADHVMSVERPGSGKPGDCCHHLTCNPRPLDCSSSFCPPILPPDCPEDSFRPDGKFDVTRISKYENFTRNNFDENQNVDLCCLPMEPCVCKPDYCKPVTCPEGYDLQVLVKSTGAPGSCCDEVQCLSIVSKNVVCEYKGQIYAEGQIWKPDPCSDCFCKGGLIFCKKYECPETNWCTYVRVPEHECCPVCIGCKSEDGEFHNFTDQWQKNECTMCSCGLNGAIFCHEQMCSVDCDNPVKISGRCCPICEKPTVVQIPFVCPSIEMCNLMCEFGMKRDPMGCFICECATEDIMNSLDATNALKTGISFRPILAIIRNMTDAEYHSKCNILNEKSCSKRCGHGYERDAHGCLTCNCKTCPPAAQCYKSCLLGFESNENGCMICRCRKGTSERVMSKNKDQTFIPIPPKQSDTSCQSLSAVRDNGEWWFDGCRYCFCDGGREFCSMLSCSNDKYPCYQPASSISDGNECCTCGANSTSKYQNRMTCHSPATGKSYVEGEFWHLDRCVVCTCHIGHVLCNSQTCGPAPCSKTEIPAGQCCPICHASENNNIKIAIDVQNFTKNEKYCHLDGQTYLSGSQWKVNSCKSCICLNGSVKCFEEKCDAAVSTCNQGQALYLKGVCCPVCLDSAQSNAFCRYKDIVYSIDEHWSDGHCRNCTCKSDSSVLCVQLECPKCATKAKSMEITTTGDDSQCCPSCNIFETNGQPFGIPSNEIPSIYTGEMNIVYDNQNLLGGSLSIGDTSNKYFHENILNCKKTSKELESRSCPDYMKPGTTSSALVILSVLSSVAILLLIIISIVWIYRRYKKSSGRCRPSSEASTSSGGSDPILRSIYGYHFHRPYNLYDDKKVDRPDGAFLAKHPAHERRGTPRINIQQCRSLLTLSPCDSDGCSTALTSDGGTI